MVKICVFRKKKKPGMFQRMWVLFSVHSPPPPPQHCCLPGDPTCGSDPCYCHIYGFPFIDEYL